MTLKDWATKNNLKIEASSLNEIAGLKEIIDRDLEQAANEDISEDLRLSMAFNSALQCGTLGLRASGYRLQIEPGHHRKTIESLRFTIKPNPKLIKKLDEFRKKRAKATYDTAGTTTESEVRELIGLAKELRSNLKKWLRTYHKEFMV